MVTASIPTTNLWGLCVDCGAPATGNAGTDGYCDDCGAKYNARRQSADALDQSAEIITLLDVFAAVGAGALFLHESSLTGLGLTAALWLSSKNLKPTVHRCTDDSSGRIYESWSVDVAPRGTLHVFPAQMGLLSKPSTIELTEPSWRPADNDEQAVADVTAPAIREALAKPHWTSDHTTALDADSNEVITTTAGDRP